MATTEERVDKLETKFSTLSEQFAVTMAKVDLAFEELKQQREDLRRAQDKHDADMRAMNQKIDSNQKEFMRQLHNNFVQTMLGVGAMLITLGGLLIAVLK